MKAMIDTLSDDVIHKVSKEASEKALSILMDGYDGDYEVLHQDQDLEMDLTCKVKAELHRESDDYGFSQEFWFSDIEVNVILDYSDPPLTETVKNQFIATIEETIENYLIA